MNEASTPATISDAVAAYKHYLKALIDRRPSGTRQRIAESFGTHKSFVSQIISPSYRVPLPAQHIPALFRVCHFSEDERTRFLALYARAHPSQSMAIDELAGIERNVIRIPLPDFASTELAREVESLIQEFAARVIKLAEERHDPS